jgi:hypothetical protein
VRIAAENRSSKRTNEGILLNEASMARVRILLAAAALLGSAASCGPPRPEAPRIAVPSWVFAEHRIGDSETIRLGPAVGAADTAEFLIEVGEDGRVLEVRVAPDARRRSPPAAVIDAVRAWRFRPFLVNGRPIIATGKVYAHYAPRDRWQDAEAAFPEVDYDSLKITLERFSCFGSCPEYRVEISGDGTARFTTRIGGGAPPHRSVGVFAPGYHVTRIDPGAVRALVERFRQARFFGLADEYRSGGADAPAQRLTFETGRHSKAVFDYVGERVGMPQAVRALHEAVDRAARTETWVTGTAGTAEALAAEGFDFSSERAVRMLGGANWNAPEQLFLDFLARGVALERRIAVERRPAVAAGRLLLERAVRDGHRRFFEQLAARGWLDRVPDAELGRWFVEHGSGCDEAIARALVRAGASPSARDAMSGEGALHLAVRRPHPCDRRTLPDRLAFFTALVRLGVDPNARDDFGNPPLFGAQDPEYVRRLLALGARTDVVGRDGAPILWTEDDRIALLLLRAGANPRVRGPAGYTLRDVATERGMIGTLRWLDERGIK